MSGGHWGYMGDRLEYHIQHAIADKELWSLIQVLEHELDWGWSGDSCRDCAIQRTGYAISAFFDEQCVNATKAMAIARDSHQHRCVKCTR